MDEPRDLLFHEWPMFNQVMTNEHDICRRLLEVVLGEAVDLRHGFHWVVLNASAWETLAEGPLRSLLKYVAAGEEDGDALVADIAAAVRRANGNAVWRQKGLDMLTYIEDARIQAELIVEEGLGNAYNSGMEEGLAKGMEQGIEQGEDRFGALVAQLLEASRIDDVAEASSNPHRRNELFQEFGI